MGKSVVFISTVSTATYHWNPRPIWFAIVTYKHKGHFSPSSLPQRNLRGALILSIPYGNLISNMLNTKILLKLSSGCNDKMFNYFKNLSTWEAHMSYYLA